MSRYARIPIKLPKGVELKIDGMQLMAKGAKGTLALSLPKGLRLRQEQEELHVEMEEGAEVTPAMHGLYRSLVNNLIIGVHQGYEKRLSLIGVGYRATLSGHHLDLALGFSHPIRVQIPANIKVMVDKNVAIQITGADKQAVGQFAAQIRAKKPPEPYKGKGVRYENEVVRKKAGKAAKGKAA